jgi:hypothetical protein
MWRKARRGASGGDGKEIVGRGAAGPGRPQLSRRDRDRCAPPRRVGQHAQGNRQIDVLVCHRLRRRPQAMRPQRSVDIVGGGAIAAALAESAFRQALVMNVQVGHRNSPWLAKEILFLL